MNLRIHFSQHERGALPRYSNRGGDLEERANMCIKDERNCVAKSTDVSSMEVVGATAEVNAVPNGDPGHGHGGSGDYGGFTSMRRCGATKYWEAISR